MSNSPRLPADLQGERIVVWTAEVAKSWAWAYWLKKYSKQPDAPSYSTVSECVAHVMRLWKAELQG